MSRCRALALVCPSPGSSLVVADDGQFIAVWKVRFGCLLRYGSVCPAATLSCLAGLGWAASCKTDHGIRTRTLPAWHDRPMTSSMNGLTRVYSSQATYQPHLRLSTRSRRSPPHSHLLFDESTGEMWTLFCAARRGKRNAHELLRSGDESFEIDRLIYGVDDRNETPSSAADCEAQYWSSRVICDEYLHRLESRIMHLRRVLVWARDFDGSYVNLTAGIGLNRSNILRCA
ncbi:hypothetical protein F5Y05DRAFT_67237 [Hypoxylon sp. FL0543]|nr:hypothetical protein F5Y05DRAFT_67237 [Hypoxylon sp. FL0543]